MRRLAELWRREWFTPAPLVDLALCRIAFVGFQLGALLLGGARAHLPHASGAAYEPLLLVELLLAPFGGGPPSPALLSGLSAANLAAGVLALAGLWTRASLALFGLGTLFLLGHAYSYGRHFHPEALLALAVLSLACAPAGARLSLDRLLHARGREAPPRVSELARWPLRLVQWLLVLAYLSAVTGKLAASGLEWMNGTTLQAICYAKGVELERPLGVWIARQHELAVALSWLIVAFQASFFLALLSRRARAWLLPLGALLHAGIWLSMGASFFQMVVLYAAFAPWRRSAVRKDSAQTS